MNILVYLIGNTDRHPENRGFLIDNDTNQWFSLYPVMDFNQSFLAYDTIEGVSCKPLFPAVVTQKEAAIDAVKHIGLRQINKHSPIWNTASASELPAGKNSWTPWIPSSRGRNS